MYHTGSLNYRSARAPVRKLTACSKSQHFENRLLRKGIRMKEKLERINAAIFRALEPSEELSMIGGAETKGPSGAPTMIDGLTDHVIDIQDDPPVNF